MQHRIESLNEKFLITFSHVAKHRSFSSAAKKLFMTQAAVSQHIKKIESVIGAKVLKRRNGLSLTQHGEVLLDYTEQARVIRQKLLRDLELLNSTKNMEIAVETSESCILLAESYIEKLDNDGMSISMNCYNDIDQVDVNKYDIVFSHINFPGVDGESLLVTDCNYALATNFVGLSPLRIIYCSSMDKEEVRKYLTENDFEITGNTRWMSTSSMDDFRDQYLFSNSVYLFPRDQFSDMGCEMIDITHKKNIYAWINRARIHAENGKYLKTLNDLRQRDLNII